MVKHLAGSPPSPYDWKSNQLVLLQPQDTPPSQVNTSPSMKDKDATASHPSLKVAFLTGCRPDLSKLPARAKNSATQKHRAVKDSSVIPPQLF